MSFTHHITAIKDIFIEKDTEIEKLKAKLKKKNEEIQAKKEEIQAKNEEISKLQDLLNITHGEKPFQKFSDYILHVCKDGEQRTVRDIFDEINKMTLKPWSDDAKTPCNTCNATCAKLFNEGKLLKTNHIPRRYYKLL